MCEFRINSYKSGFKKIEIINNLPAIVLISFPVVIVFLFKEDLNKYGDVFIFINFLVLVFIFLRFYTNSKLIIKNNSVILKTNKEIKEIPIENINKIEFFYLNAEYPNRIPVRLLLNTNEIEEFAISRFLFNSKTKIFSKLIEQLIDKNPKIVLEDKYFFSLGQKTNYDNLP